MATKNTNTTNTKTKSVKATKSTAKKEPTKAELEAEIAALKAQLLQQANAEASSQVSAAQPVQAPITFTVPSTDVTVVYCSDSMGHAAISNMDLNFNQYGEEFIMSRTQFDELVGKYRRWFDDGILAVSSKDVKVAAAKGLKTDKEVGFDANTLQSIKNMSPRELEAMWNTYNTHSNHESIVSYYKRKFIEGDSDFINREKVDLLNRLTNGGFSREQDELSGRYKINPTEM